MIGDDLQQAYDRFEKSVEMFLADPGVLTAMDVDDRAGQMRRVLAARQGDREAVRRLSALQEAARSVDRDLAETLFKDLRRELIGQGLLSRFR